MSTWVRRHRRAVGIGVTVSALAILGIAAVLGWAILNGQQLAREADTTPTAQPTPSSGAFESSGPSTTPHESSSASSAADEATAGWIAVTLVDDLTVREEPSTSANPVGVLGPAGEAVFVVSGPVSADGHDWYQLALIGELDGTCALAREPSARCRALFGWAAGTGADAEPWLAPRSSDCPPPSLDTATYVSLPSLERLACFGDATWTLRAYLPPPTGVYCGIGPHHDDPAWLSNCAFAFLQAEQNEYESGFAVHVHPDVGACTFRGMNPECPFAGLVRQWIEVRGHLDDPAALSCVPPVAGSDDPGFIPPDSDSVILDCRAQFVATSVTPSGPP